MPAPLVVQTASAVVSGTATPTCAFTTSNVTAGNYIVVAILCGNALSVRSVTDNSPGGSNTYSSAISNPDTTNGFASAIYWAPIVNGGGTKPTIKVTWPSGIPTTGIVVYEVSNISGVDAVNHSAPGATGTAVSSGLVTATNASDFIVGAAVCGASGGSTAAESGWTNMPAAGNAAFVSEYKIITATGSYTATWTQGATGNKYTAAVAAFLPNQSPSVTVQAATSVTASAATLNGTITSLAGRGNATAVGFQYGPTLSYGYQVQTSGSFGAAPFSVPVTGLAGGIRYHSRAFAVGPAGTGYSADQTFVTGAQTKTGTGEVLYNGPTQLSSGTTSSGSVANLFDANNLTGWFTSTNAVFAGIDAGAPVTLTRLRYSPYPSYEDYSIGATINGDLADSTFATGAVTLATLSSTVRPSTGLLLNEVSVSAGTPYRYYNVRTTASLPWGFSDLDFIGQWASGVYSQPVQPTLSPFGGNFDKPTVVSMSSITTSAQIYYTTDGTTPTTSSTLYTGPIVISANTQIKAIAFDQGLSITTSRVTTAYFFAPSQFYSHNLRYDNRGYKLTNTAGCIFKDPVSGYWFNYLGDQDTTANAAGYQGQNVYRSADLRNWSYMGNVCGAPIGQQTGSLTFSGARCQMYYCAATSKYVAWLDGNSTGTTWVYTSTAPDGSVPFTLVAQYNATHHMADGGGGSGSFTMGDIGSFVDPVSGDAYLIYNNSTTAQNSNTIFSKLDPASYTNTLPQNPSTYATYATIGEAHTMWYYSGTYFYLSSRLTGLSYSLNTYRTSSTPIGPWSAAVNPFSPVSGYSLGAASGNTGSNPDYQKAYFSQTDQVISIPGRSAYIWTGDNFQTLGGNPQNSEVKLFLPLTHPTSTSASVAWRSGTWFDGSSDAAWNIDTVFPTVSGAPLAATGLSITSGGVITWTNNEPKAAALYLDSAQDSAFTINVRSRQLPAGATSASSILLPDGNYRIRTVNVNGTTNSAVVMYPRAPAFVQGNTTAQTVANTSVTCALSGQAAGDMNVVIISGGTTSVTITGVTDTAENTYHLVKSATGSLGCLYIYVAFNISAYSGSNTITAAFSGSTKYNSIVAEYSGVSKVAVDQSAIAGPTTSSAPSSGSVTTTFATELLIGAFRVDAANQWSSAGSGWTVREQVGSNSGTLMDKVVTSTGTYSATATLSLSETWLAGILTIGQ